MLVLSYAKHASSVACCPNDPFRERILLFGIRLTWKIRIASPICWRNSMAPFLAFSYDLRYSSAMGRFYLSVRSLTSEICVYLVNASPGPQQTLSKHLLNRCFVWKRAFRPVSCGRTRVVRLARARFEASSERCTNFLLAYLLLLSHTEATVQQISHPASFSVP